MSCMLPMTFFHPDFKLVDRSLSSVGLNAEGVNEVFKSVLQYQTELRRRTTPWERKDLDVHKLLAIVIDPGDQRIDRLYSLNVRNERLSSSSSTEQSSKELIFRMQFEGQSLFVDLLLERCKNKTRGFLFFSRNANVFMRIVLPSFIDNHHIYLSLAKDGIEIKKMTDFDYCERILRGNVPTLKFLCTDTVNDHKERLQSQFQFLPQILADETELYIKYCEAKQVYDEMFTWAVCV